MDESEPHMQYSKNIDKFKNSYKVCSNNKISLNFRNGSIFISSLQRKKLFHLNSLSQ
jgi:hypothetical protein